MSQRASRLPAILTMLAAVLVTYAAAESTFRTVVGVRSVEDTLAEERAGGTAIRVITAEMMLSEEGRVLEVIHRPGSQSAPRVVATDPVSSALGLACTSAAIPLMLQAEIKAGGAPPYLAHLAGEVVEAAAEGGRFSEDLVPGWAKWSLAAALAILSMLAWRQARGHLRPAYEAPGELVVAIQGLEDDLERCELAVQEAHEEQELASLDEPVRQPGPWYWLPPVRWVAERRHVRELAARRAGFDGRLRALELELQMVYAALDRERARLTRHRRRHDVATRRGALARHTGLRAAKVSGPLFLVGGVVLAAVVATGAMPATGGSTAEVLLRQDTLVSGALSASPDLEERFRRDCGMRLAPMDTADLVTASVEPVTADYGWGTGAIASLLRPGPSRQSGCSIGTRCGGTCIPAGRTCRIGIVEARGQPCGRGYIALGKTCRLDGMAQAAARPLPGSGLDPTWSERFSGLWGGSSTSSINPTPAPLTSAGSSYPSATAAPHPASPRPVEVHGYTRQNGTVVEGYTRSAPGSGGGRHR